MEHIRGIGKLKSFSDSLTLGQFRVILRLTLDHEGPAATVFLKMATSQHEPPLAVDLRFDRVVNFKTDHLAGSLSELGGFDVRDISSNGWERINWEAIDYEDGHVHWYAEDFEILDVSPLLTA